MNLSWGKKRTQKLTMCSMYLKSYLTNVRINPNICLITFDAFLLGKKVHLEAQLMLLIFMTEGMPWRISLLYEFSSQRANKSIIKFGTTT